MSTCPNPLADACQLCSSFELRFGCGALAESAVVGSLSAFVSWLVLAYLCAPVVLILATRSSSSIWACLLVVIELVLNEIFQHTIHSSRPPGACVETGNRCGMPSGHCSVAWGMTSFLWLYAWRPLAWKIRPCSPRGLVMISALCVALLMPWARVASLAHTPLQAAVGCAAGLAQGVAVFGMALYLNPGLVSFVPGIKDDFALVVVVVDERLDEREELLA